MTFKGVVMIRILSILVITVFCSIYPATASEKYRKEITQYVIDPCYAEIVNRPGGLAEQIDTKEAVEMLKVFAKDEIENVMKETIPIVSKLNFKERKQIYSFSRQVCIKGAGGG